MPIYMKYGNIRGDVTAKGYEGWIELQSCDQEFIRGITSSPSRATMKASLSQLIATKRQDNSTPAIFLETQTGKPKVVEIHYLKEKNHQMVVYMKIKTYNTVISSYSKSGILDTQGNRAMESFTLNFDKADRAYITSPD